VDCFVSGGLMLVGDSARMVNPIHGGGIGSALEAAIMCAEVGSAAIKDSDVSKERLMEYDRAWRQARGAEFKRILRVRHLFEKLSDEHLEIIAESVDPEVLVELGHGKGLATVAKVLMKASPGAAKFALSFLKGE
ncbi:MAG: hypothetical protein JW834_02990, partial [Candidatus Diapherotrites archaeon]|nr:hypothetical protein [Candidatus Diapherotrites archaeon]